MKIGFIPIDNRPVCYNLPIDIAAVDKSIEIFLPDRNLLGNLTKSADVEKIFEWIENLPQMDAFIVSLDTLAYGGLIPSRRCSDTFNEIKCRIEKLKMLLTKKNAKIFAFSSIMRISNNNVNEEEKEYWNKWGKKIFNYSFCMHKFGQVCRKEVPDEILDDYLSTRKRNFEINKIYLDWQKQGFFDTLVFSKDDCAEFGFNVQEAQTLESLGGFVKTGADEIPLTLLARAVQGDVKIAPVFLEPEYKNLVSNYEDVSVEKSVLGQIELSGCSVDNDADIVLFVNNFKNNQGEIVMGLSTNSFDGVWLKPESPYMIADVRFANGADNKFVEKLFKTDFDKDFYGYSAWNTTANSLGSLICAAKIKFLAKNYDDIAFRKLQVKRFLDDWAYQANVRQLKPDITSIKKDMSDFEKIVTEKFDIKDKVEYSFPWNRLFEVEIEFS